MAAYDATKLTVPNAPTVGQPKWGKSPAADAGKQATNTWKCVTIACNAWYTDAASKCKTCGKARLKDKEEKKPKPEVEYLTCSKQGQEVLGRLCMPEDGDDTAMASSDYMLPLDQVELVAKRNELSQQVEQAVTNGFPKEAVDVMRLQLSKLPKPSTNQPVQDWACLTAQSLAISKAYRQKADVCEKRRCEILQEKADRAKECTRELEEATKEHEARMEAISVQHAIHLADTHAREEANLAMSAKLEEQNAEMMDKLKVAIDLASKKEAADPTLIQAAVVARPSPPTLSQAPLLPVFTAEGVQAASSGTVLPEQAAAFAAMMNTMLAAAMVPAVVSPGGATTPIVTEPSLIVPNYTVDKELAEELASLNGGGKPGFTGKPNNRVNPLSG
jgi:hypothetical protein